MFTTPARPVDILTVLPELAVYAKNATRLHPRRGVPESAASSVAGPMLWPAGEPWPTCQLPHMVQIDREATAEELAMFRHSDEVREQRFAQMISQFPDQVADPDSPLGRMLAKRQDFLNAAGARAPRGTIVKTWAPATPNEPVVMVPVVQLHAADIPEARFPAGTDLVQILWCPYRHPDVPGMHEHYSGPAPKVIWRAAGSLTDTTFPARGALADGGCVLEPCVLNPERIIEYPDIEDLPESLQSRIYAWQESLGEGPGYDYRNDLSVAPGLKAGGWPYWPHCPRPVQCSCGSEMSLLLTMPHGERGAQSWTPLEDQFRAAKRGYDAEFHDPTGFSGARDELLIFVCRQDPLHDVWVSIE
ncbi:hypothetical protein AB0F71_31875 [Kitasatospora sp. NPDC028055]|uniref:hypothetical protein n=1 Tax=Kitasatospora sp. NPDC028055 TaxID=3155653 RepID=UPI0034117AA2